MLLGTVLWFNGIENGTLIITLGFVSMWQTDSDKDSTDYNVSTMKSGTEEEHSTESSVSNTKPGFNILVSLQSSKDNSKTNSNERRWSLEDTK